MTDREFARYGTYEQRNSFSAHRVRVLMAYSFSLPLQQPDPLSLDIALPPKRPTTQQLTPLELRLFMGGDLHTKLYFGERGTNDLPESGSPLTARPLIGVSGASGANAIFK
ncbi:hypothetical protein EVAR_7761_1 [Eumeta japonica]|uniref:Uncharacterized protein n=1 Tax=Eumeta variegata TaxID=151549 RepID=A0A4C1TM68_EUMVA|nr:hypothetical protein EVAR_7761_1 [Eumeta japonica]